ncbi:TonB-dependent receptor [Roseateles sp. DAIF2]|uniref:TonB-dependent receptor domain-containing protein n=1 Tax=Roseateles sp. DAIF2 TaxID=2714952 RepID=UPI0018A2CF3F|nr:TonB-dependent receptor [Roseateles sp. DAIF2]QPF75016.1 TonB-dependent receptor [Roseateles sp. DAIF2]
MLYPHPSCPSGMPRRALAVAAFLSLAPLAASAQQHLAPVVVTGTREAQPLSASVADVVLIDREALRDGGLSSVEEALRRHAGLQLARNGGPGQNAGYFLRGTGTSSTVVLIDGVRVGSATLGQANFENMSLAQIERIEVLRGPASSLYGADAVGGVIHIITRRGEAGATPHLGARLAIGGERSREGHLEASGMLGGFDYAASVARESSRGISAIRQSGDLFGNFNPDRDGFKRDSAQLRLGFTPLAGHRLGLSASQNKLNAQFDGSEYGPPPDFKQDASPDFRNHLKARLLALDYRGRISEQWTTSLQLAKGKDELVSGANLLSSYETEREQLTWQNALRFAPGQQLVLAYEQLREQVAGNVITGAPTRRNKAVIAGYAGQFGAGDAIGLEASLRRDDNSAYGDTNTGNIGASYALSPQLKLRALAGKTFRAPTFNDLYYPGYGVATLHPEEGRSAELGLAWSAGDASAGLTVYRNSTRNLIVYSPDNTGKICPPGQSGCPANLARATLKGATLSATQRWGGLNLRATLDFLDAKDDRTGDRVTRRAAHQESLSADYEAGAWNAGASLTGVGARPDGNVRLGAYAVLDLRASWRFLPQWRLEAKLLNAADRRIEPVRDYQDLGRQAWIGLRFDNQGF